MKSIFLRLETGPWVKYLTLGQRLSGFEQLGPEGVVSAVKEMLTELFWE